MIVDFSYEMSRDINNFYFTNPEKYFKDASLPSFFVDGHIKFEDCDVYINGKGARFSIHAVIHNSDDISAEFYGSSFSMFKTMQEAEKRKDDYNMKDLFKDIIDNYMNDVCMDAQISMKNNSSSSTNYRDTIKLSNRKYKGTNNLTTVEFGNNKLRVLNLDVLYCLISDIIKVGIQKAWILFLMKFKDRQTVITYQKISEVATVNKIEKSKEPLSFRLSLTLKEDVIESLEENGVHNITSVIPDLEEDILTIDYLSEM